MIIKENEHLDKYTTLKIGGIARKFYIPETTSDLLNALVETSGNYHIIANGSNLLINDKKVFENVIYMNKIDKVLELNNGIIEASSSVKIQELINFANENNYGGIEYLYSVPATVGGAIYMNAGRGKSFNKCISDYIISIKIFDGENIKVLNKNQCDFKYRSSIFNKNKWVIISATFKFEKMMKNESSKIKSDRIKYSKECQDLKKPNSGTVFCESNYTIMKVLRKLKIGWKKGVSYSGKTTNWIINNGKGTYKQAKFLIMLGILIHKISFKKVRLEYVDWN